MRDGGLESLCAYTAGLSLHALLQLLKGAVHEDTPITSSDVIGKVEEYIQSQLGDDIVVARAALRAKNSVISLFIGLSDEGFAVPGGSFIREADGPLIEKLEMFNRTQDYSILESIVYS